jgi:hypothetical protein
LKVMEVRVCVAWSGPALATGSWFGRVVDVVVGVTLVVDVVGARLVVVVVLVEVDVVAVPPVPMVTTAESLASDQRPRLSRTQRVST